MIKVSQLRKKSEKVLNIFTETKNELLGISETLIVKATENEEVIEELKNENEEIAEILANHDKVILNINKIFE